MRRGCCMKQPTGHCQLQWYQPCLGTGPWGTKSQIITTLMKLSPGLCAPAVASTFEEPPPQHPGKSYQHRQPQQEAMQSCYRSTEPESPGPRKGALAQHSSTQMQPHIFVTADGSEQAKHSQNYQLLYWLWRFWKLLVPLKSLSDLFAFLLHIPSNAWKVVIINAEDLHENVFFQSIV